MDHVVCSTFEVLVHHLEQVKTTECPIFPYYDPESREIGFSTPEASYTIKRQDLILSRCQEIFLKREVWERFLIQFPDGVIK